MFFLVTTKASLSSFPMLYHGLIQPALEMEVLLLYKVYSDTIFSYCIYSKNHNIDVY